MKALALYNRYARSAFALLAFVCAASVFLYGTFLLLAVGHAAGRAHAQSSVQHLKSQLGDLENRYLAATQSLTPQYAVSLGYVHPEDVAVVYATQAQQVLTLNTAPATR